MYKMVSWVFYTATLDNTAKKEAEKGALLGKEPPEMRKNRSPEAGSFAECSAAMVVGTTCSCSRQQRTVHN
jgi:hypothetical protein